MTVTETNVPAADTNPVVCPVWKSPAAFAYSHPEADIYRCQACTHAFSDQKSLRRFEEYSAGYYNTAHKNWFENPNFSLFEWIERQIPLAAASVIDVGCGRGQFLDYLRQKRPSLRLVGVDLSANLDRDGIQFLCGDVLEFQLDPFDAVISLATIEHVPDPVTFASNLHDLCNPGGVAFVMTLDDGSLLYRASRAARMFGISVAFDRLYSSHHLQHFTHRSLVSLLENAGFQVRRSHHHSVPLKALDLPVSPSARPVFLAAVGLLFAAGDLTRLSYLQTIMAVRPAAQKD